MRPHLRRKYEKELGEKFQMELENTYKVKKEKYKGFLNNYNFNLLQWVILGKNKCKCNNWRLLCNHWRGQNFCTSCKKDFEALAERQWPIRK